MNTTDLVHYLSADVPRRQAALRPALSPSRHELAAPVRSSILRARRYLVGEQRLDGSWAGQRSGDVTSLSQLVLLLAYLGREQSELAEQVAHSIKRDQRPEGGWSLTLDGPFDLNASVMAYFALKIAGADASQPDMSRTRQTIREHGGADAADTTTRWWLALLGQIEYECCPAMVPERLLMLVGSGKLPASDERRLAALSVVWALRPRREIELVRGVRELFLDQSRNWPIVGDEMSSRASLLLTNFWLRSEKIGFLPLRKQALDRANSLLTTAAIEAPPAEAELGVLAWQWIALEALGHLPNSRVLAACECQLLQMIAFDAVTDEARSQQETSLTEDTALATEALQVSGVGIDQPPVAAGLKWLVDHRLQPARESGNVREMAALLRALPNTSEVDHAIAPDLPPDMKLASVCRTMPTRRARKAELPVALLGDLADKLCKDFLSCQHFDGGWSPWSGAQLGRRSRGLIRSTDHRCGASSPDATGAMLEIVSRHGVPLADPAIGRAANYLRITQQGDGSWDSATGARLLHGTTWAVRGLIAAGARSDDPAVAAGVNWLFVEQQESGGWGEAVDRTARASDFVAAAATALQTAWAVLALVAAGYADHDVTRRGVRFLVDAQDDAGRWCDEQLTIRDSATGSWYRNDLHSVAVPLLALARWAVAIGQQNHRENPACLRLVCDDSPN